MAGWPQVRRAGNGGSDGLGLGTTLIVGDATAPWEVLANPVGPDIVDAVHLYPLKFRRLEGSGIRRHDPIANGYSARYSEIVNCWAIK